MTQGEAGRVRGWRADQYRKQRQPPPNFDFVNPYPYMSRPEARVHMLLEERRIPFSWRYFNAPEMAPMLQMLMPDYHPEFTLKEYKTVIVVNGVYFSTLPGVLDRQALGVALLQEDGWRVISLWEDEIERSVFDAVFGAMPELRHPAHTGPPTVAPWPKPTYLERRREYIRSYNLSRKRWLDPSANSKGRNALRRRPRRFRSRRRRTTG